MWDRYTQSWLYKSFWGDKVLILGFQSWVLTMVLFAAAAQRLLKVLGAF